EGENGFVVENPADSEAIAERIKRMLHDDVREKMGREALKTAGENSWDRMVARVITVYEEIWADQRLVNSKIPHP
ncbi:MAG: glycosyltransferase, partial [Syntrophales bacterium]